MNIDDNDDGKSDLTTIGQKKKRERRVDALKGKKINSSQNKTESYSKYARKVLTQYIAKKLNKLLC